MKIAHLCSRIIRSLLSRARYFESLRRKLSGLAIGRDLLGETSHNKGVPEMTKNGILDAYGW